MASSLPFTDDIVEEILSRLPIKSLCRCKCVCRSWRNLISHPDRGSKLPPTLAGFFHRSSSGDAGERFPPSALPFTDVSRKLCPPSIILPEQQHIMVLDCCNGLVLCRGDAPHYIVCNPATDEWTALPGSRRANGCRSARLCFDPAVSSHFHVVEFLKEGYFRLFVAGVEVYSSETGKWTLEVNRWDDGVSFFGSQPATTVFLNGFLHFISRVTEVAAVDMEGRTWRVIPGPAGEDGEAVPGLDFIQRSQGRLHYAMFVLADRAVDRLVIYVLEDYGSQEWILKHSAEASVVFGGRRVYLAWDFEWVGFHPEWNLIFFTLGPDKTLMSYDMDRHQVQVIHDLGHDSKLQYLPYMPSYSKLQALTSV